MYKSFISQNGRHYLDEFGKYNGPKSSFNTNIERDGYFITNKQNDEELYIRYLLER